MTMVFFLLGYMYKARNKKQDVKQVSSRQQVEQDFRSYLVVGIFNCTAISHSAAIAGSGTLGCC
jgi:hypothetical protein